MDQNTAEWKHFAAALGAQRLTSFCNPHAEPTSRGRGEDFGVGNLYIAILGQYASKP